MTNAATSRADARRNYDQLLETARQAFLKNGAGVALEAIAKQAGVGIGTLYRHFPDRDSLLAAVYAKRVATLTANAGKLALSLSPDKALLAWLQMITQASLKYGGFASVVQAASTNNESQLSEVGSKLLTNAQVARLLRSDITIGDILRLINGATLGMSKEDVKRVDALVEVIVTGLKNTSR